MLQFGVSQVYAACEPGSDSINLSDCLTVQNPDGTTNTVSSVFTKPTDLVNLLVSNIFILGGIILFFMIFVAGYKFIAEGTKGKDEAQQIITTAAIGMIVMLSAYWILQIIKVVTGIEYLGI